MKNFTPALEAALDKECQDNDKRLSAKHQFHTVLVGGGNVHQALAAALNAAAHDGGSYVSMENTFWEVQGKRDRSWTGRIAGAFEGAKSRARLNGPTVIH